VRRLKTLRRRTTRATADASTGTATIAQKLPLLPQIRSNKAARVELDQCMRPQQLDSLVNDSPHGARSALFPAGQVPNSAFSYAFNGYASAHRVVYSSDSKHAEQLLWAERAEMDAAAMRTPPADGSLYPRVFALSLHVPETLRSSTEACMLVDAFATLVDTYRNIRLGGMASLMRCTVYLHAVADLCLGATVDEESSELLHAESACTTVVLRWARFADPPRSPLPRVGLAAAAPRTCGGDAATVLHTALLRLFNGNSLSIPEGMNEPPPETSRGAARNQVSRCSRDFYEELHLRFPTGLEPTPPMQAAGQKRLTIVANVYLRMLARKDGAPATLHELSDPSCVDAHALLLCGEDAHSETLDELKKLVDREGWDGRLDNPWSEQYVHGKHISPAKYDTLQLHTVATVVYNVSLQDKVSLYGTGGVPGETIRPPHTHVHGWHTKVSCLSDVLRSSDAYVCRWKSVVPCETILQASMCDHMTRSRDMVTRFGRGNDDTAALAPTRAAVSAVPQVDDDADSRYLLASLGVSLTRTRLTLGEVLDDLCSRRAPSALIKMLTGVASERGARICIADAFDACNEATQERQKLRSQTDELQQQLKLAVSIGAGDSCSEPVLRSKTAAVIEAMNCMNLCAGASKASLAQHLGTPRPTEIVSELAWGVYEAYTRAHVERGAGAFVNCDAVQTVLRTHADLLLAIAKSLNVCMLPPGVAKTAYIVDTRADSDYASLYRVGTERLLTACLHQDVRKCDNPCIVLVVYDADGSCTVTPVVRNTEKRKRCAA